MTRKEGIAEMTSAIERVKEFIKRIEAIPGSRRDKPCDSYIGKANQFILTYSNDVKQYKSMSDEEFLSLDLYYIFKYFRSNLKSLEIACQSLVARGPQHTPGSPTKKGPY